MNLKQRFSVLTATALPLLALSAYLFTAPTKAQAFDDCPDGGIYSHPYELGCGNGAGGYYYWGSTYGSYVFCSDGQGGNGGQGYCDSDQSGCVICNNGPA